VIAPAYAQVTEEGGKGCGGAVNEFGVKYSQQIILRQHTKIAHHKKKNFFVLFVVFFGYGVESRFLPETRKLFHFSKMILLNQEGSR